MRNSSKNYPTYAEIREELRNAGEHISAMMKHEEAASSASDKDGNPAEREEAERLFLRDFKSFIGAVRSARDYLKTAANKSKCYDWLEKRFDSEKNLFEFYCFLANQSPHQYRPRLEARTHRVQYVGEPDSVLIPAPGGGMIPDKMRVVGLVDPKFFYKLDGLEHDTKKAYEATAKEHPNEGVVLLSLRYFQALQQILKNAERNRRFAKFAEETT